MKGREGFPVRFQLDFSEQDRGPMARIGASFTFDYIGFNDGLRAIGPRSYSPFSAQASAFALNVAFARLSIRMFSGVNAHDVSAPSGAHAHAMHITTSARGLTATSRRRTRARRKRFSIAAIARSRSSNSARRSRSDFTATPRVNARKRAPVRV
ncbi:MAG: hypothetical protein FD124_3782 [Alphaproteobacteria bacterium]|nr:MAG: hypothetical protein FD124_3782 [Alphaproteobacteria bacterium]